jgi:hypothetical protein
MTGIECRSSGGNLDCITPGGRRIAVPAEGFADNLAIAPGEPHYHYYSTPDGPVRIDPSALTQGVIHNPTLGPRKLVRPATPEGTPNEATPNDEYQGVLGLAAAAAPFGISLLPPAASFSPVKSYLTADQNGTPMVVNVTQPGHPLHPGVVIRYVTTPPSGSTIQNEGSGLGVFQSPGSPEKLREWINSVWKGQSGKITAR